MTSKGMVNGILHISHFFKETMTAFKSKKENENKKKIKPSNIYIYLSNPFSMNFILY